ncbi:hypothetical protein NCC49_005498 [Naganishia albida]|nr:hypothetical protein NCC49_005498 [Naganishia albida]
MTPPLPQPRQEPPASLQIRSTGRLTDHMKMASIHGSLEATTSTSNTVQRDSNLDRSSANSASQPPAPSKLRLIDRIQPARYVPPEKHETISLRPQNGPPPRPGAGSTYRPDYAAESRTSPRDSPRTGDSYRPERAKASSPALTFKPQVATAPTEPVVKDDGFASQKHVEKLPEWLEANDPKLDSDVPSGRRRPREQEDTSVRSGSTKRTRYDRDARPPTNATDSLPLASARAPPIKDDQDSSRGDYRNISNPSTPALNSRSSDKPNCTFTLSNRVLSSGSSGMPFEYRYAVRSGLHGWSENWRSVAVLEFSLCRPFDACAMPT